MPSKAKGKLNLGIFTCTTFKNNHVTSRRVMVGPSGLGTRSVPFPDRAPSKVKGTYEYVTLFISAEEIAWICNLHFYSCQCDE
jgi:hypothetical protein